MEINANRLIGREMVPMRTDILAIEPTSACNLKCSFCAYVKKDSPKITMKNDRFAGYVGQAVAMGYRRFHLTPNTGDIFMDRRIFDKLKFLEEHPEVEEYQFYTNFTILDSDDIARLVTLKMVPGTGVRTYFCLISKAAAVIMKFDPAGLNLTPTSVPSPVVGLKELPARSAPRLGVKVVE